MATNWGAMIKVVFDHQMKTAKGIHSFYFRPRAPLRYIAGQFIELYLPHDDADERGIKRWFTLSSSPTEDLLTVTTKLSPDKSSSFKSALQNLQPGAELNMAAPMGDFVLPKDSSIPLLFVAAGIGSTPYRSMIKYLQDVNEQREIGLIYVAASRDEIAFNDVLDKLSENFHPLIGKKLNAQKILKKANHEGYIYLSGSEPLVEKLDKDLKEAGVEPTRIHTDFFLNYSGL